MEILELGEPANNSVAKNGDVAQRMTRGLRHLRFEAVPNRGLARGYPLLLTASCTSLNNQL
jgi:hypothetical protein